MCGRICAKSIGSNCDRSKSRFTCRDDVVGIQIGRTLLQRFLKLGQLLANDCVFFGLGAVVGPIEHGTLQVLFEVSESRLFDSIGCGARLEINEGRQTVVKVLKRFKMNPLAAFVKHRFPLVNVLV